MSYFSQSYSKCLGASVLASAMLIWPFIASASDACLSAAKTELERAYCKVVKGGEGAGLPSFDDFRRNDAMVQALLLKRPAERIGLKLPSANSASAGNQKAVPAPSSKPLEREPSLSAVPAPRAPVSSTPPPSPSTNVILNGCRFTGQGDVITCGNSRYLLAANKPKNSLASGVLDDTNHLNLPSYEGRRSDNDAVIDYLSKVYAIYIPKMLEIGLGAATLSFTEFHHAFHTTESAGIDFARRSEETFRLLKADRRTMAVQTRLHDRLPASIDACMDISGDIIVCDDVGTNWVFVRPNNAL